MIRTKSLVAYFLALLINLIIILGVEQRALYVVFPILFTTNLFLLFTIILRHRIGSFPFFDVGFFCVFATFVYTVYPLLNYLVDDLQFGLFADSRLNARNISPQELGRFHYRHVLYIFCLATSYLLVRNSRSINVGKVIKPKSVTRWSVSAFFIILSLYFIFLKFAFGLNFNSSYEDKLYSESLRAIASAPLILVQFSTKLIGILFLFKLALLFFVISNVKSKPWRYFLVIWITYEIIDAILLKGSRSNLMFFLLGAALLYHRMIKKISVSFLFFSGGLLFVLFIFMGIYRFYNDIDSLQSEMSDSEMGIFTSGNEFQAILGTSFDVYKMREGGKVFPSYLYLNDFISVLPPQQLLPFKKVEASEWYLRELGINGTGVGFMWGVVSQSLIGLDWVELAFRGALLGLLLGLFHNYYVKNQASFLWNLLYVYACLRIYYTFRDTTFSPIAFLVWQIIPFFILIKFGEHLFRSIRKKQNNPYSLECHEK